MTTEKMSIREIESLERLTNSAYGNPRYRVHFTDGSSAVTQSDASFCYGLTNRENFGVPVRVTWTRAGRIAHIEPERKA